MRELITISEYKSLLKKKPSKAKNFILSTLESLGIAFESEYKFLPNRKFKADYAIPAAKILIEYEGLFSNKSRHTTAIGYTGDLEKYNLATLNGYRLLRYSALNYRNFAADIKELLKGRHLTNC